MFNFQKKKENFEDPVKKTSGFGIGSVFMILIMIIAFYLSWTCNIHKTPGERVVRAVFAAVFGIFYLVFYLATKSDCYSDLKKMCDQLPQMSPPQTLSPLP
jgi:hypothetical protein